MHELLDRLGTTYGLEREIAAELDAWRTLPVEAVRAVLDIYCGGREFAPPMALLP